MTAQRTSVLLIAVGVLLLWPIGALVDQVNGAALGAILIAVGLGGALASAARTRRGTTSDRP
jgi:hypothetical protein